MKASAAEVVSASRAIVDLGAIARNFRWVQRQVGSRTAVCPVVKADAYGHGAVPVARRLAREGADRFAVATTQEAVALRRAGIVGEILVLFTGEPAEIPLYRAYGLTATLHDLEQARAFSEATAVLADPLPVHLKLDTGMGRAGIRPEDLGSAAALLRSSPKLVLVGTFSHLSSAEDPSSEATYEQITTMKACLATLENAGVSPGLVHLANTAGVIAHPDSWFDAVRPGLALYGVLPAEGLRGAELEPAMTLETFVCAVKRVPTGTPLGYGGRFITSRASTIALLPIGYHDGFRRSFSGCVSVLLRGREAPVVGAVSMDLTLVDATESGAERGDRAVWLGSEGERRLTTWDLARAAGTIPYEILCGIGERVVRVYTE